MKSMIELLKSRKPFHEQPTHKEKDTNQADVEQVHGQASKMTNTLLSFLGVILWTAT